jgi:hypothetical protein
MSDKTFKRASKTPKLGDYYPFLPIHASFLHGFQVYDVLLPKQRSSFFYSKPKNLP